MLKHLYLILASTFVLGFMTGAVVYLQTNTGREGDGSIEPISKGMTIVAEVYGGCSRIGCPSYRIENSGAYTYIVWSPEGGEVRYEDVLTDKQRATLLEELKGTDFEALDDTEFTGTCPITFDGPAYQYDIEYKGERYEVDSCVEVVDGEPLFATLEEYFNLFSILYSLEE
jgi:hypothetical protein